MNARRTTTNAILATGFATVLSITVAAPANAQEGVRHCRTPAIGVQQLTDIDERYWSDASLRALLGQPVDSERPWEQGSYRQYQHGWMYSMPKVGVRETHGVIADEFEALGGHRALGAPMTDECPTEDGVGRYNHFAGGDVGTGPASIYWSPETGAQGIWGAIRVFWRSQTWETGPLGYPTTTTAATETGGGLYNDFQYTDDWDASVYWSEATGAHSVQGAIRQHWLDLGGVESRLEFPTSNEYDFEGGRRGDFQGGYVTWHPATGIEVHHE